MLINDGLYAVAEKVPLHIDRCKSIDEFSLNGKLKRKESKRDIPEGGLTKRSGLHLPSVKGLDGKLFILSMFNDCTTHFFFNLYIVSLGGNLLN